MDKTQPLRCHGQVEGEGLVLTIAPWRYPRRERNRDGFSTFCPIYELKRCAAGRDEDDTYIRPAGTQVIPSDLLPIELISF